MVLGPGGQETVFFTGFCGCGGEKTSGFCGCGGEKTSCFMWFYAYDTCMCRLCIDFCIFVSFVFPVFAHTGMHSLPNYNRLYELIVSSFVCFLFSLFLFA